MGTLRYGFPPHVCAIEDRALAHLRIIIVDRLRRGERFAFSCSGGDAGSPTTLWMSPGSPVKFAFSDQGRIQINRGWVRALERASRCVEGLHLVDEPPELRALPPARQLTASR